MGVISNALVLPKKHVSRERGSRSTAARGKSSSCTSPALHLVTFMYMRQKEQIYITKMQLSAEMAELLES